MKNINYDHVKISKTQSLSTFDEYWPTRVIHDISVGSWSKVDVNKHIDLTKWQQYLADLPKDNYVDARWKRMSWIYLDESGDINTLEGCPMAQGGRYNDAHTMADKLRYYPALDSAFLQRNDVQLFIKAWARLWGVKSKEPILMQINGIKGACTIDPLQGQGIHQDGSQFLSILVVSRENVTGGENTLYGDKGGKQKITQTTLEPGEVMHIRDNEVFHNVSSVKPLEGEASFERFVIIINCRFNDSFQNEVLRQHFPDVVLNQQS